MEQKNLEFPTNQKLVVGNTTLIANVFYDSEKESCLDKIKRLITNDLKPKN